MRRLLAVVTIFMFLFIGPYALPSTVMPPVNGDDAGDMYAVAVAVRS